MGENNKKLEQLPIVMISMSRWDGEYSSAAISLAKEFAKTSKVYYLDHPFTWKDVFFGINKKSIKERLGALFFGRNMSKHISGYPENLYFVTPGIVLPINWLPDGWLYRVLLALNNRIFFRSFRKLLNKERISDFIYFNSYNPFFGRQLPADIRPGIFIYQSRDDISESEYVNKHGVPLEIEALNNADINFATGRGLIKKLSKYNSNIFHLPNAADISIFNYDENWERPPEIREIKSKIVGYMGNICHRIDYDLLYQLANKHKDKIILMIGPRNDANHHKYDLDALNNVIFTGGKHISELPAYLYHVDCAIIPFKTNELTKGIYPLKINEYLSLGKPVVTTNFSEDLKDFEGLVYIANTDEEFLNLIDTSIEEDTLEARDSRVKLSKNNDWSNRVNLFWEYVSKRRS